MEVCMDISITAARSAQSQDDIADIAAQARDIITWLLADAQGLLELAHSADGVPDDVVAAAENLATEVEYAWGDIGSWY
jgi:hypothetical protein